MSFPLYARSLLLQLGLLAVAGQFAWAQNDCDLSQDGAVNLVDVQLAVNMALGLTPCTANINGAGICNVVTVQRVINASLGQPCVAGTGPSPHTVTLTWTASTSPGVSGYSSAGYRIDIRDFGIPIPSDSLSSVFDLATVSSGSFDRSEGGLELAMCKMIMQAHKGELCVESGESGTVFSVILPCSKSLLT